MQIVDPSILVGVHASTAGGLHKALLEGMQLGATTIQFFTSNQKQWKGRALTEEILDQWNKTRRETGLTKLMSHDSYLINLGCPNSENLEKSQQAFKEEIVRCTQLGVDYLNFHPGAALTESPERCLNQIIDSLLAVEPLVKEEMPRLLLETTAGQGSTVGHKFEQLAYIIENVKGKIPIGVCIDTCHIFVAGYDLRTAEACDHTLKEFDRIIGLPHLYAFHFNDSLKGLGSRVDRHQPLGEGEIGWECFKFFMTDDRTKHLPKYLETPGGLEVWSKEIPQLKKLAMESKEPIENLPLISELL